MFLEVISGLLSAQIDPILKGLEISGRGQRRILGKVRITLLLSRFALGTGKERERR